MKSFDLEKDFTRGWLVGMFSNPILLTDKFEICIKKFKAGETESIHYHKLTTEVTIVISGVVEMCGKIFKANSVIVLEPEEASSFKCVEDAITVAFRNGSFPQDKYIVDPVDKSKINN